ncbi:prepilin peptidase [Adlercreutzia aquisgranensis]|uniref:prepilin peptidase n=1 Tax=Adlercreutzia aquisgranensis TaxID=2941323 RepID=UPI002040D636|nr:prepilin peptidase [Adlercreutzia aquisgranensis]
MAGWAEALRALSFAGCFACVGWAVAEDLRRRRIPRASCYGVALCGLAAQLLGHGVPTLAWGLAYALVAMLLCAFALRASRLLARRRCPSQPPGVVPGAAQGAPPSPIGGGDIRLIAALCVATGPSAPSGVALCAAGTVAVCAIGLACGRLRWRDGVPYAPFLALWPIGSVLLGP